MTILMNEMSIPTARNVIITDDTLSVDLNDGRTISVPLAWFPRLLNATEAERNDFRFIGKGSGIHFESIDEDISIEALLLGKPSGESQKSFQKWLNSRSA
ncbi:MAG: DUF2442 domain-containing protein [Sulfuricurvum sp.]|uniref:DUF2442 domain-containing protein n=1 Tax=Sulfuricurvum sp. TaxID=2025608 RepID=UPI0025F3AFD8|nr:DUF2442 domain-containing protein [Sulfuricurvum sp.]MCK9372699.1 DUF2442 domain-containing protein [Sulfuricurvum sp.]